MGNFLAIILFAQVRKAHFEGLKQKKAIGAFSDWSLGCWSRTMILLYRNVEKSLIPNAYHAFTELPKDHWALVVMCFRRVARKTIQMAIPVTRRTVAI